MKLVYELSSDRIFPLDSEPPSAVKYKLFGQLSRTLGVTVQDKAGSPLNDNYDIASVKSLLVDGIKFCVNSSSCLI